MHAERLDIDIEARLQEIQAQRARHRSRGRHASDICGYYLQHVDPSRFSSKTLDPLVFHKGFLWEDVLSEAFGKSWGNRQVELHWNRVFGTVDGLRLFKPRRINEYKNTKMSAANDIRSRKFHHWHIRTMMYLYMATMRFGELFNEAELVVLFLNGSYELGGGRFGKEKAVPYLLRWSWQEINDNWQAMMTVRDEMDEKGI